MEDDKIPVEILPRDFRFSASYASRYHNCHGSARLHEAIPGFVHPEQNERGMKGEGTRLHKIFQEALSLPDRLYDTAKLLRNLALIRDPGRRKHLQNPTEFVTKWYLAEKSAPPLDCDFLLENLYTDVEEKNDGVGTGIFKTVGVPPRRIAFLAEALEYVADLIADMDPDSLEIFVEVKKKVEWLDTAPNTTVDLILKDKDTMHVLDLKSGEVSVSPVENEQLMYYGRTFGALDFEHVTLHILQRENIDNWRLTNKFLLDYTTKIQTSEQEILAGDLTLSPGDHCKFCPANPHTRGDKGNKACPAMMRVLYGERDVEAADAAIITEEDDL